ncbi:rhodanese-like domain-containing protein [Oceanicoccus sp. KOV_DT_Chl]|uniref:rhodanese-like domain-containing protein n=1 Tax=Oceanicoccus sp. KOV_DT_Chl TaxID=1904639 RepID=UPI001F203C4A|nr:rhodanese-like domain-containing protein [Oceanicoccus sp. KOV_DT_Chl]
MRDSKEFDQGHIVDALHIPHAKLADRINELEAKKSQPVVLVCKIGQHSGAAGKQLKAAGFEHVFRLNGGMMEWSSQQLPLVTK